MSGLNSIYGQHNKCTRRVVGATGTRECCHDGTLRLLFADPPAAVTVGVDDTGLSVKDLPPPFWSSIRNRGPRDRSASGTRSKRMSPSPNKCRLAQSP